MKRKLQDITISQFIAVSVATILALIPFHAFLTVWLSSGLGHYTALRLWKECLLLLAGVAAIYVIWKTPRLKSALASGWLWRLIGAYTVVVLVWGAVAYRQGGVAAKADLYGILLDLRPFAMVLIAWVAASTVPWLYHQWQRLVLWPAAGVVAIGLLQYFVLPYDVMKHFGYNGSTIWPYETIDHKTSYIRIRSTLRGANLLGAYMIIVLSSSAGWLTRRRRLLAIIAIIASLVVLFASGSRGAWLGMLAAAAVLGWLYLPSRKVRKLFLLSGAVGLLLVSSLVVTLRNNDLVQNLVFHTDEHSTSKVSSNSAHVSYSIDAIKQIATEPLGRGPGTAGPAGVYNTGHTARIAENYFLQIGQELGWLGLGIFLAIYGLLARGLWQRRHLNLSRLLLASFVGLTVMALLMHLWTDDTAAYLWFGLAGIALAQPAGNSFRGPSSERNNNRGVKSREKPVPA
jgi:hypothetical protein